MTWRQVLAVAFVLGWAVLRRRPVSLASAIADVEHLEHAFGSTDPCRCSRCVELDALAFN